VQYDTALYFQPSAQAELSGPGIFFSVRHNKKKIMPHLVQKYLLFQIQFSIFNRNS
jgi:hypothetical protein